MFNAINASPPARKRFGGRIGRAPIRLAVGRPLGRDEQRHGWTYRPRRNPTAWRYEIEARVRPARSAHRPARKFSPAAQSLNAAGPTLRKTVMHPMAVASRLTRRGDAGPTAARTRGEKKRAEEQHLVGWRFKNKRSKIRQAGCSTDRFALITDCERAFRDRKTFLDFSAIALILHLRAAVIANFSCVRKQHRAICLAPEMRRHAGQHFEQT